MKNTCKCRHLVYDVFLNLSGRLLGLLQGWCISPKMDHGSRRRHNLTMPRGKAILCVFAQTHLTLHKIENLVSLSVELKTAYARMFSHDAPFRVHERRSWFFHPSILGTTFARIDCAQKPIAAPHEAKPPDPKASIFTPDSSIFRFLVRSVVETGPPFTNAFKNDCFRIWRTRRNRPGSPIARSPGACRSPPCRGILTQTIRVALTGPLTWNRQRIY